MKIASGKGEHNNMSRHHLKPTLNIKENGYLLDGLSCFKRTFKRAMSFHYPEGLAAVCDETGAYHITIDGTPLYPERYEETFGYYRGIAAVRDKSGFFHINTRGEPLHKQRYLWSGNFQEDRCVVQDDKGFFHIDYSFAPLYEERFDYAGDFRYGIAVARRGSCAFHILDNGQRLYGHTFENTDVFHKGFAVTWDAEGAFHVDKQGKAIHGHRFKSAEPFYNGFALCETHDDRWVRLMENGHFKHLPVRSTTVRFHEILDRIQRGEKAALVLRHAEREPIPPGVWGEDAGLNRNGQLMAGTLGRLLGKTACDWTFVSSTVERCVDTCLCLAKGMGAMINQSQVSTTSLLGSPGPFKDISADQSHLTPDNFMDAGFPYIHTGLGKGFRPLADGCRDMMDLATQSMQDGPAVLITHDFFIAGLFDHLGLLRPSPENWVDFLDGVCFFSNGSKLTEWRRFQGLKEIGTC